VFAGRSDALRPFFLYRHGALRDSFPEMNVKVSRGKSTADSKHCTSRSQAFERAFDIGHHRIFCGKISP
jgi:hypothetical protein